MSFRLTLVSRLGCVLALLTLAVGARGALAGDLKLDAQLVWGTNDAKSPDPTHKPVGPNTQKKLRSLPFNWTNYFEVNRQQFTVPNAVEKRVSMSKDCDIRVKNLGNNSVEMVLYGQGRKVGFIKQALPKGELLVTGGNAANFTAWFVVLKQAD